MPADGDAPDARELESAAVDLEAVAVLPEAEPGEAVLAFEARVTGIVSRLDPAKERLERLVQVGHHVLEDVAVDASRVGAGILLGLDLAKLLGPGDRHAAEFVGVLPLAQEIVVEVAARLPHGFSRRRWLLLG